MSNLTVPSGSAAGATIWALSGVVPPMISPLTGSLALDAEALPRLVEHILDGGGSGLFVLGGCGEGAWLTLAQRAAALGMLVLGYDSRTVGAAPYMQMVELDELLQKADFISLHIPLTPETRHIIRGETLDLMKPGAILINVSRGALIDTTALIEALKSGRLGGVALGPLVFLQGDLAARELLQTDAIRRLDVDLLLGLGRLRGLRGLRGSIMRQTESNCAGQRVR